MNKIIFLIFLTLLTFIYIILSINPLINNKRKDEIINYFYDESIIYETINKNNYKKKLFYLTILLSLNLVFVKFGNMLNL